MTNKSSLCTGAIRLAGVVVLSVSLASCADLQRFNPFNLGQVSEVQPLASADVCHTPGTAMQLHWFTNADALHAFEKTRRFHFDPAGPLPSGPFAVIELGMRDAAGYGFAISRMAHDFGDTLVLSATFFEPSNAAANAGSAVSPCALVALPVGTYRHIQLRDPVGTLRVSSGLLPESSQGES